MRVDRDGWLQPERPDDPGVIRVPTVRTTVLHVKEPLGIVHHTTDDPPTETYAEKLAKRWADEPGPGQRSASIHMIVAPHGMIYQLAPFTVGTWHVAGKGGVNGMTVKVNAVTVGVEWCNAGRLKKVGTEWRCYPYTDPKRTVPADTAQHVPSQGYWQSFTAGQEEAAAAILRALVARYRWSPENCALTHEQFDPSRREDPGPIWTGEVMPRVLAKVFGGAVA